MRYGIDIKPSCQENILKLCKKSPILQKALKNKMEQILDNPYHYKPLRYELAGERRVHILKSFVLTYEIDENNKTAVFLAFNHHDNAY